MSFAQFIAWSARVRDENPGVHSFAETRISRALQSLKPTLAYDPSVPRVYRCDLVKAWCVKKGLLTDKRTSLACEGVRQALKTLFTVFAQEAERVAIPQDVYPVYARLADEAGLVPVAFPTFPDFDPRAIFDTASAAGANQVLLPCPLKLHGRAWSDEEVCIAQEWLLESPAHRLILDAVYDFGAPLDAVSRHLSETDQVIYLDSLSKGYLHAEVFGAAVVPEQDVARFTSAFRALSPNGEKLAGAEVLLRDAADVPSRVAQALNTRRAAMLTVLARESLTVRPVASGYLVPVHLSAEQLLLRHSILAIPASVFGCADPTWSLASCL
jgi:aspartate/methionine/tyrosine aminotransferase